MSQRETLTAIRVKNLKVGPGKRVEIRDMACPGLILRATSRTKTFGFAFQKDGKRRYVTLGTYPAMGLSDARRAADEQREGKPAPAAQVDAVDTPTIRDMFDEYIVYLETVRKRSEGHIRDVRNRLRDGTHSFLTWLHETHEEDLPPSAVTPEMCRDWMGLRYRQRPKSARHDWAALHAAFTWAVKADQDYMRPNQDRRYALTINPAGGLLAPPAPKARKVMVKPAALRAFWNALPEETDAVTAQLIYMVICMGGVRVLQFARLRKEWVRDGWIYWPEDATKGADEHILPLTRRAKEIYRTALAISPKRSPLLFPSPWDIEKQMNADAISKAVARTLTNQGIKPRFQLRDWRRTFKTEGRNRGLFEKHEGDIWHLHADKDVSERHYTFAEFRTLKMKVANAADLVLDEYLAEGKGKEAA